MIEKPVVFLTVVDPDPHHLVTPGSATGSAFASNKNQDPHPDPHQIKIRFRIRIRVKSNPDQSDVDLQSVM
jgi:hypothetical protein